MTCKRTSDSFVLTALCAEICGASLSGSRSASLRLEAITCSFLLAVTRDVRKIWSKTPIWLSRTASQYQHVHSLYGSLYISWYVLQVHLKAVSRSASATLSSWL